MLSPAFIPRLFHTKSEKRIKEKDIFSATTISKYPNSMAFAKKLGEVRKSPKKLDEAFANHIYLTAIYRLRHKSRLLKRAGWVFLLGLIVGVLLILLGFIISGVLGIPMFEGAAGGLGGH